MTTTPLLIGLCGPAGCGKDTTRAILEMKHDFAGLAFAEPMRDMVHALMATTGVSLDYLKKRELKEVPVPGLGFSVRHMMQTLGTEWARNNLSENFWIDAAAATLASFRERGHRRFVISDVRYPNEAAWIRQQGGEVWMIDRPGLQPVRLHSSECLHFRVDQVLRNDGTLANLERATLDALVSANRFAQAGKEAA